MATKMRRAKDCEERRLGQPGVGTWDRTRTALLAVAGDLDSRMSGRCIYTSGGATPSTRQPHVRWQAAASDKNKPQVFGLFAGDAAHHG